MSSTAPCIVIAHELLHIAARPVTAVPSRALWMNTEDDRGGTRMAMDAAGRTVVS